MGKLLLFFGIVLAIVGAVGMALGFTGQFSQIGQMITSAVESPDPAVYCQPGERLEEGGGASSYTPGLGYGRTITYACVDELGNRRDVTDAVMDNLFGSMGGLMGSIFNGVGSLLLFGGLCSVGGLLALIGLVVVLARGRQRANDSLAIPIGAAPTGRAVFDSPSQSGATAEARLQRLEQLYASGMISAEEYERLRQQILDSL